MRTRLGQFYQIPLDFDYIRPKIGPVSTLQSPMSLSKQLKDSRLVPLIVILLLTAYQLVRVIAFVNVYGGVEHDGGWALTVARDLAERGDFTTTISTIVDPSAVGDINIDQKFDIQAPDGRIWFRTGNAIGPASIVPDALVLKIFGAGFWARGAGPLIFYTLFLLLAAYILYQLAGLWSVFLFHAFLFFYPHLSIFLSYEALGEVPAMVDTLGAYQAFAMAGRLQVRVRPGSFWPACWEDWLLTPSWWRCGRWGCFCLGRPAVAGESKY